MTAQAVQLVAIQPALSAQGAAKAFVHVAGVGAYLEILPLTLFPAPSSFPLLICQNCLLTGMRRYRADWIARSVAGLCVPPIKITDLLLGMSLPVFVTEYRAIRSLCG